MANQRPLFQHPEQETHFRKHGYVIVPFFDAEALMKAHELSSRLNGGFNTPFTTTIWSEDKAYRKEVLDELKKLYQAPTDRVLQECKLVMATILTKHTGENSQIDIHQDWSFTDETQYSAVNIWVPLVDTTPQNGALCLLPHSQLFDVPFRGRHITPQFVNVKNEIWSLGQPIVAKAGEAIIFDVKMVHYSNPNQTLQTRTATAMVAIPREAPILHYINYNPSEHTITAMEVDEFFYNSYAHNDPIPRTSNYSELTLERTQLSTDLFKREYEKICLKAQEL
jgi:hypothetical protein